MDKEQYYREFSLLQAIKVYGDGSRPPQAIIDAAILFEDYLAGDEDEFVDPVAASNEVLPE